MKIKFKHYDTTITIEQPHDDQDATEMAESVCPQCGDAPLRAHYSGGRAIRKYCDNDSCDWKAELKGEGDE